MAFSVAMSVYGKDDPVWFGVAIDSILNQTLPPDEIVLVVDGPVPPALNAVIEEYEKQPLFRVIRFAENRGLGEALRQAVLAAKYDIIARMDSDDISVPDRFAQQIAFFEAHPETDILGGDIAEFIGEPENIVAYRTVPKTHEEICAYLKVRCPYNHMTVMFRKQAVLDAGNYQDCFWNEDYYLWIRMAEHGCNMANTGTVLVQMRTGEDMYRRRGGKKYFRSEVFLQKYMLSHKTIGIGTFCMNVLKRLILQILLPNRVRGWVFRKFARRSVTQNGN